MLNNLDVEKWKVSLEYQGDNFKYKNEKVQKYGIYIYFLETGKTKFLKFFLNFMNARLFQQKLFIDLTMLTHFQQKNRV